MRPFSAADIHSFSGAACDGDWPLQLLLTPAVDLWQRTWRERSQILSNVRPQTTQLWRTALVMWAGLRCVSAWARNCQGRAKVSGQSSHLRRILSFYDLSSHHLKTCAKWSRKFFLRNLSRRSQYSKVLNFLKSCMFN